MCWGCGRQHRVVVTDDWAATKDGYGRVLRRLGLEAQLDDLPLLLKGLRDLGSSEGIIAVRSSGRHLVGLVRPHQYVGTIGARPVMLAEERLARPSKPTCAAEQRSRR